MSAPEAAAALAAVNDDQVMARVRGGSTAALGVLYDRYHERAYRVARSVCRDDGRAAEAVHEAFISIWKTRDSYETKRGTPAAWVLTVTRNRAIDIARRNGPHAAHRASDEDLRIVPEPGNVAEQVVAGAEARDLRSLLTGLPDAQREVITLAFYGQLTHGEIATHLDLPVGTIKGRMRLGLQRLRRNIDSEVA
ncbi:MAG: sigma-70 family RNA polymerase sigma factor [Actinomycetota bacterium]|nr:sigma-70 family RNA polymerase sigma factor [Actinomycetota bacterium]